jgi:carboxypeptidase T
MLTRRQGWGRFSGLFILSIFLALSSEAAIKKNYSEVRMYLREIQTANALNAVLFELGTSDGGPAIEGLKIGSGPIKTLIVATHHGNEYGSAEVALAAAKELAAQPIADQTIYVVPVLNIQGYNQRSRYEIGADKNPHDPNRDYPGPCGTDGPFRLKSTRALAEFVERESIVTSATLHTYFPAVVYPWGLSSKDLSTPYDTIFKELVEAAVKDSHYQVGNSTEVIYPADGTYEDYAYWKHGIWSILFELGFSHSPSQAQVDEMVRVNVPGLRNLLMIAPRQRAENHAFTGRCDPNLWLLDRRDE